MFNFNEIVHQVYNTVFVSKANIYFHSAGKIHGHISNKTIHYNGELLKLSTHNLRKVVSSSYDDTKERIELWT